MLASSQSFFSLPGSKITVFLTQRVASSGWQIYPSFCLLFVEGHSTPLSAGSFVTQSIQFLFNDPLQFTVQLSSSPQVPSTVSQLKRL